MLWRIRIQPSDQRKWTRLPDHIRAEVKALLQELREDPRPPYSKPLQRELQGLRTIRVDGWRLIYMVNDEDRVVTIIGIRPRGANTYLNL